MIEVLWAFSPSLSEAFLSLPHPHPPQDPAHAEPATKAATATATAICNFFIFNPFLSGFGQNVAPLRPLSNGATAGSVFAVRHRKQRAEPLPSVPQVDSAAW